MLPHTGPALPTLSSHGSFAVSPSGRSNNSTTDAPSDTQTSYPKPKRSRKKNHAHTSGSIPLSILQHSGDSSRPAHTATQLASTYQPVTSQLTRTPSNRVRIPVLATLQEGRDNRDRLGGHDHIHDGGWECARYHMSTFTDPSPGSEIANPLESSDHRELDQSHRDVRKTYPPSSSLHAKSLYRGTGMRSFRRSRNADPSPSSVYGAIRPQSALPMPGSENLQTFSQGQSPSTGPRAPPLRRDVSRGRQMIRDVRSLSAHFDTTPSDMVRPHPAFFKNTTTDQQYHTSRALGQNKRGPPPPTSHRPGTPSSLEAQPPSSDPKDGDIEGSRRAWFIAWSGFFVTFSTWGLNTAFGVYQAYYATVLLPSSSLTSLAWIGSIQLFLMFFLGTPIGALMDRGHFRLPFNGGSALLVLSLFATSWCTRWWHFFLVQGFLTGLGMGLVFPTGAIMLMSWFAPRQMGRAMMLGALGAPVGSIVYIAVFRTLILRTSFAITFRIIAGIATLTLVAPNIIARPRKDGSPAPKREMAVKSLKDGPYLAMAAGFFLAFWGLYVTVYYLPLYSITQLHTPGSRASDLLLILSATNVLGRLLPGVMSDACTGPLNLVIPTTILCGLTTFSWIPANTSGALIVIAALYGFFSAGLQALYTPALHAMTMHNPETMGIKSGFVFTVIGLACLTGAPIAGALVDQEGLVQRSASGERVKQNAYLGAQLFSGGCMIAAAALLVGARWLKVGWKGARF